MANEKVKEFSAIIHTIRHDIRNFIAAIEGYTYLLKEEFNPDYLTRIFSNITNITELVDRSVLLTDAELPIEKLSDIDLNIILKANEELIPETVLLEADQLGTVKGDYTKMLFVFKSLVETIMSYEPTTLVIRKSYSEDDGLTVHFLSDGNKADEEKILKQLQIVPQSLKPNSGFSLLASKRIVEAHGWELHFSPDEEGKCCFCIRIPAESVVKA